MSVFEVGGIRLDRFQLSAVKIHYPYITSNNYCSLIPNIHLENWIKQGVVPSINPGSEQTNKNGLAVWRAVYSSSLYWPVAKNYAEITLDLGDIIEHWYIPIF